MSSRRGGAVLLGAFGLAAVIVLACSGARVHHSGAPPEYEMPESLDGAALPVSASASRTVDAGRDAR